MGGGGGGGGGLPLPFRQGGPRLGGARARPAGMVPASWHQPREGRRTGHCSSPAATLPLPPPPLPVPGPSWARHRPARPAELDRAPCCTTLPRCAAMRCHVMLCAQPHSSWHCLGGHAATWPRLPQLSWQAQASHHRGSQGGLHHQAAPKPLPPWRCTAPTLLPRGVGVGGQPLPASPPQLRPGCRGCFRRHCRCLRYHCCRCIAAAAVPSLPFLLCCAHSSPTSPAKVFPCAPTIHAHHPPTHTLTT